MVELGKTTNKIKMLLGIFVFCVCLIPIRVFAAGNAQSYLQMETRKDIEVNKVWRVNFTLDLDPNTINRDNIKVVDKYSKNMQLNVKSDPKDATAILIDLPTLGYVPGKEYTLIVEQGVMSKSGCKLYKPVSMKFSIKSQVEDGSDYGNLPKIEQLNIKNEGIRPGDKIQFDIKAVNTGNVQYRIYLYKVDHSSYKTEKYKELTKGYTGAVEGNDFYTVKSSDSIDVGDYKILVYVKRAGVKGAHEDENTDFDNYYTDYIRCVENTLLNPTYKKYDISLEDIVYKQYKSNSSVYMAIAYNAKASENLIRYYMDTNNFVDTIGKYMFMKLDYFPEQITVDDLNSVLKGKGILDGQGQAFFNAAKKYNVNPLYLVVHAILETGHGKSALAQGVNVTSVKGKSVPPKVTYNFFGVGAVDASPLKGGSERAYEEKWFTPEAAVEGGTKFIGERYLHNKAKYFEDRHTLYAMKWNPTYPGTYQYATDILWAYSQAKLLDQNFKNILDRLDLLYEVPKYK